MVGNKRGKKEKKTKEKSVGTWVEEKKKRKESPHVWRVKKREKKRYYITIFSQ